MVLTRGYTGDIALIIQPRSFKDVEGLTLDAQSPAYARCPYIITEEGCADHVASSFVSISKRSEGISPARAAYPAMSM